MTTAVTVPPADLQAILDGRQWLVVAPTTCPECSGRCYDFAEQVPCPRCGGSGVVPASPPAPDLCPDCYQGFIHGVNGHVPHADCGGSGTVPGELLLCAEQCRKRFTDNPALGPWGTVCAHHTSDGIHERRTAGLVLVSQPTYLPVVDRTRNGPNEYPAEHIAWLGDEAVLIHVMPTHGEAVTDEPFAPLLAPGGVLVTWDRADTLDPPIVEMTVEMRFVNDRTDTSTPAGTCRVPLSVTPGFTTVEVP